MSNEPRKRLGMLELGTKVIIKGDPARRVFELREGQYEGYFDLWIGKHRVVTAAPSQEVEVVSP